MILHFYFARRFLLAFALIVIVFFALISMINLIDTVGDFDTDAVGLPEMIKLSLLAAPSSMNDTLPLIMILATVTLFIGLARSSELVATRAAGRSAMRALMAPVTVAFFVGLLAVSTLNPIVAATSNRHTALSETYRTGTTAALSISGGGLWLRQAADKEQSVIYAARSNPEATLFFDVTFLTYTAGGKPVRRVAAETAQLTDGAWVLTNAKVWPLAAGLNPEANATSHETLRVPSSLTLDRIRDSLGTPSGISIWDLPDFINQLERAGFSTRRHQVWLQSELARPIFLIAMVLVAAAFTMRHTRFGGTGVSVLAAVLLGFALYFVRNFAQILGENGQIPIALSAWAPPVAAILLALGLLLHAEDG